MEKRTSNIEMAAPLARATVRGVVICTRSPRATRLGCWPRLIALRRAAAGPTPSGTQPRSGHAVGGGKQSENDKSMSNAVNEKNGMPSMSAAEVVVRVLSERGIVEFNDDERQCKGKVVALGLSMPKAGEACLMYGREGDRSLYLFVCLPDPARGPGKLSYMGFRFDMVKYRSNPVPGMGGVGEAFLAFMGAVARLEGIDLGKCRLEREGTGRN